MRYRKYRFGEVIQRENTVPDGMFLIFSGQCKVCKYYTSERALRSNKADDRAAIKEKSSLFNNFNAENTYLNRVAIPNRVFQNSKLYITEDGAPVPNNKMLY